MSSKITDFKIKVAIADDCKITRDLLIMHLHELQEFKVIIEASNGKILLDAIKKSPPHVAVIDVRMDIMDGIETTRAIKKINPEIKVVAYSNHNDILTIYKMADAGAEAFLDKETTIIEYKKCLKAMYEEGHYYNEYFNRAIHESISQGEHLLQYRINEIVLSEEEIELTKLVCKGFNSKDIADELFECRRKAQVDMQKLLIKTRTGCIALLVRFAYLNGIVSLNDNSEIVRKPIIEPIIVSKKKISKKKAPAKGKK